ncbi:hypothetical protein [Kitasatospora sp. NPDC051914]|uniref:hypothetical protein n=1 Tax=Kitasatospora sp. NPDC051914 TaxID=3154945 RepID=UPI003437A775
MLARIAPDQTPAGSIRHGEVPRAVTARPRPLVEAIVAELRHQAGQHPGDLRAVVCADHLTDVSTPSGKRAL